MDLTPDDNQEQLIGAARTFLLNELPLSRLHAARTAPGVGDENHRKALAQLGWFGVGLSEADGGAGLSIVEEVLLFREIGRLLGPTSVLATVLAAQVCASAAKKLIAGLLQGDIGVALAVADGPTQTAGRLTGAVRLYDCHAAKYAFFCDDAAAWLLELPEPAAKLIACLDKSVTMAEADLADMSVVARCAGDGLTNRRTLLVSAMLVGQAEATRDMINAYAKVRETFGRPIGSYQAVRHPIAEMAARCEHARSLLFYAALAQREHRADAAAHICAAYLVARNAALQNADWNIQLHGGIGVTDEFDAHLYLKRAHVLSRWCGSLKTQLDCVLNAELSTL